MPGDTTTGESLAVDPVDLVRGRLSPDGLLVGIVEPVGVAAAGPSIAYVGLDNGVSGSIGLVTTWGRCEFFPTPTFETQDYTKAKKRIRRIDTVALFVWLSGVGVGARVFLERPMLNPMRWAASISAIRAFEATIITLERLLIGYTVVDSRGWQGELLPSEAKGPELKVASMDVGIRLFPGLASAIRKQKDADGILLAEYARRKGL